MCVFAHVLWVHKSYFELRWGYHGHSWEDLGVIWGLVGAILCHVGVILELSWENLGVTWLHLGAIFGHPTDILGWGHVRRAGW